MIGPYKGSRKALTGASLGVLLVLTLSGCLGGGEEGGNAVVDSSDGITTAPTIDTNQPIPTESLAITDPKRHFHHYWEGRTEVTVFEGELELEQDPFRGAEFGCNTVGHREFNLEDDGDDSDGKPNTPPVNKDTGRADTIFAGTSHLEATLQSVTGNVVGGIYFHWKPANLNAYQPVNGCGVLMEIDEPLQIPVGLGASDPPHQFAVSRWSFFVLVAGEQGQNTVPSVGQGTFKMLIKAFNGGENNLDPAHPDLYADGDTYDLGCAEETDIASQTVVWATNRESKSRLPIHRPPAVPLIDIKLEYGRIVPLLTEKVVVTFEVENTAPSDAAGGDVELWYFGGDTNQYSPVPDDFVILDPDGLKADPPYEDESLWRFMILPRPPGGAQEVQDPNDSEGGTYEVSVADFAGSYKICAVAHRDPAAVLT